MAGMRSAYPVRLGFAELRGTLIIKQRGKGKKQPVKEKPIPGAKGSRYELAGRPAKELAALR